MKRKKTFGLFGTNKRRPARKADKEIEEYYDTYEEALENCRGDEVVVEVDGGWVVMSATDYRVWVMQN